MACSTKLLSTGWCCLPERELVCLVLLLLLPSVEAWLLEGPVAWLLFLR